MLSHRWLHRGLVPIAVAPAVVALVAAGADAATSASLRHSMRHAAHGAHSRHVDYEVVEAGHVIAAHGRRTMTAPASNEKLLTVATLLNEAGPGFRYTTTVAGTGPIVSGTLDGDLVITGSGDPTLTSNDLRGLAKTLHRQGLRRVTGHVVVDDSRYTHGTLAPGWKHSFVPEETGPVDAFTIDRNTWRSGKAFDRDPAAANAARWRSIVSKAHVHVRKQIEVRHVKPASTVLASHQSAPLADIAEDTLRFSDNFAAEMMLREAGADRQGRGSRLDGIAAVTALAHHLGVPLGSIHDGSGLSYSDRESPASMVTWLSKISRLSGFPTVYAGLPASCETGTLEYRLCGRGLTGRVHAKTGTLDFVNTLSGFVHTRSGQMATFSVMLSGEHNETAALHHLDAIVTAIARHG